MLTDALAVAVDEGGLLLSLFLFEPFEEVFGGHELCSFQFGDGVGHGGCQPAEPRPLGS